MQMLSHNEGNSNLCVAAIKGLNTTQRGLKRVMLVMTSALAIDIIVVEIFSHILHGIVGAVPVYEG